MPGKSESLLETLSEFPLEFPSLTPLLVVPNSWFRYPASFSKVFSSGLSTHRANVMMDHPTGLTLLSSHGESDKGRSDQVDVDVVFVHGLGAPSSTAWSSQNEPAISWLQDLPSLLASGRAINTYGYSWDSAAALQTATTIIEAGDGLLADVYKHKLRPIIFIGHSFGGLIVKRALLKSIQTGHRDAGYATVPLARRTRGVIFLGTPHSTMSSRLHVQMQLIAVASGLAVNTAVSKEASLSIATNLEEFGKVSWRALGLKIVSFFEELPLPFLAPKEFGPVVGFHDVYLRDQQRIGLQAHHQSIRTLEGQHTAMHRAIEVALAAISSTVDGALSGISKLRANLLSVPRFGIMDDLLRSLHVNNGSDRVPAAAPGTFSWLLNHPSFNSWLDDESGRPILWISGKQGSGKTTLMKLLSQQLSPTRPPVSSFFFSYQWSASPTSRPHNTMLKSLLHQLFTSEPHCLPTNMLGAYSDNSELLGTCGKDWEWDDRELEGYLRQSTHNLGGLGHQLTLVVDGLDECDDHKAMTSFIQQTLTFPRIRLCISSRPDVDYDWLAPQRIRLEDLNAKDIALYVHSKLETSVLLDHLIKRTIAEKIARKADGVFLWVTLVIDNLNLAIISRAFEVEGSLELLPQSIDALYNILYSQASQTALLWAVSSLRPLSVCELLDLLDVEEEMVDAFDNDLNPPFLAAEKSGELLNNAVNRLKRVSAGLLTISTPEGWPISDYGGDMLSRLTVTFVHRSARDHFLKVYAASRHPDTDPNEAMHLFLAFSSLKYLCLTDQELGRLAALEATSKCDCESFANQHTNTQKAHRRCFYCTVLVSTKHRSVHRSPLVQQERQRPFLEYAVLHCMDHIRLSGSLGASYSEFAKGLQCRSFLDRWVTLYNMVSPQNPVFRPGKTTAHHLLAYYDLPTHYHHWESISSDAINEKDHGGRTPLIIAAAMGHISTSSVLLNKWKADTGIRDDVYNATPLVWASAYGHAEVVRLLLDAGASGEDDPDGCMALHVATRHGHLEVAKSLLHRGAGFNSLQAALYLAANNGRVPLINLLLQAGANVWAPDHRTEYTALHYAIHGGNKKALELLLEVSSGDIKRLRELGAGAPPSWVSRVFMKLVFDMVFNCHGRGTSSPSQSKGSNQSAGLHVASTNQCNNKAAKPTSRKRPLKDTPEDSDGEGNGESSEPPQKQLRMHPRLCCPYHKRYPVDFQGACANPGFPNIHRLKQHLFQKHHREGWHRCRRCKQAFDQDRMTMHDESPQQCEPQQHATDYKEGFDEGQQHTLKSNALKQKKFRQIDHHWRKIFQVVFPDWTEEIPDPYVETSKVVPLHILCNIGTIREIERLALDSEALKELFTGLANGRTEHRSNDSSPALPASQPQLPASTTLQLASSPQNRDGVILGCPVPQPRLAPLPDLGNGLSSLQVRPRRHISPNTRSPQVAVQPTNPVTARNPANNQLQGSLRATVAPPVPNAETYPSSLFAPVMLGGYQQYADSGSQLRPTFHPSLHPNARLNHYPHHLPAQLPWPDGRMSLNNSMLSVSTSNPGSEYVPTLSDNEVWTPSHSDIQEVPNWHGQDTGLASTFIFEHPSEIGARQHISLGSLDGQMRAYPNSDTAGEFNICAPTNSDTGRSNNHGFGNPDQSAMTPFDMSRLPFTGAYSQGAPHDVVQERFRQQELPLMSFLGLGVEPLTREDVGTLHKSSLTFEANPDAGTGSLEDEEKA